MENGRKTYEMLVTHYRKYPKMQIQDMFKFIYQSSHGCEHMITSYETVKEYIDKEYKNVSSREEPLIDALDGNYSRVHLSYLNCGLASDTLAKLFYMSSKKEENAKTDLISKIEILKELVSENVIAFDKENFEDELKKWEEQGFPAIHHSDDFRQEYKPSYRVIANEFVPFLLLLAKIDKSENSLICIEGGSASGKTTLGGVLLRLYDCNMFHMDDFFLQKHQRTPERFCEAGGNIDHERFLKEVLLPLKKGETFTYQKFDCETMSLGEKVQVNPKKLNIIEGAYSMHPNLEGYYDFSVYLDISEEKQKERINKRNSPDMAERFFKEWIPLENRYFEETDIKKRCNLIIEIK